MTDQGIEDALAKPGVPGKQVFPLRSTWPVRLQVMRVYVVPNVEDLPVWYAPEAAAAGSERDEA